MIWADRWTILIGIIFLFFLFFITVPNNPAAFSNEWMHTLGFVLARTVLPLWIVLRLIDFAIGGPRHRRGYIRGRIIR
jgi:hypothetical protein